MKAGPSISVWLAPALALAGLAAAAPAPEPGGSAAGKNSRVKITEVLRPGTELLGMCVPRYDSMLHLSSVVHSARVTLVEEGRLDGEGVDVRVFDPATRRCLGNILLERASYWRDDAADSPERPAMERIRAEGPSSGTANGLQILSDGLHLTIEQAPAGAAADLAGRMQGLLFGPVSFRLSPGKTESDQEMKSAFRQMSAAALVAAAASGADSPPPSAPPPPPAAEEAAGEAVPAAATGLRAVLDESERTTRQVREYLEMEDLMDRASNVALHKPEPVEFSAGPQDTVISCDGGAYFDVKKGVVVFMGGVVVKDPRFQASGINRLEAYFSDGAKPASEQRKDGKKAGAKWELQRMVASGAVHFSETREPGAADNEPPLEASGALFTYQLNDGGKADVATLSGGRPWMRRGQSVQRAKQSDQTITFTISKTADGAGRGEKREVTRVDFGPGGWDTHIVTGELPRKKN